MRADDLAAAVRDAAATGAFAALLDRLEEAELEMAERNQVATADFYAVVLATCCLADTSLDAKHCWNRIPTHVKERSTELRSMWSVCVHVLQERVGSAELGPVFAALQVYDWSPVVAPLTAALAGVLRERSVALLASGYARITNCEERGWTAEGVGVLLPPGASSAADSTVSEQDIRTMSNFAAFAESGAVVA